MSTRVPASRRLRARLQLRRLASRDAVARTAVDELRDGVRFLDDRPQEAETAWAEARAALRDLILNDNPARFLRWRPILDTMFVGDEPYIEAELAALRSAGRAHDLAEDPVGDPGRLSRAPLTSGNLVHHAYHLLRFEATTGRAPEAYDTIVEIGGGYGSMCRLIHRRGFRGRYHIVDLPELQALQRFYLRQVRETASAVDAGITFGTVDDSLIPNAGSGDTLVVGTWSLSEMPLGLRERLVDRLLPTCRGWLLAFQDRFADVENFAWFDALARRLPGAVIEPIDHLPGRHGYLLSPAA